MTALDKAAFASAQQAKGRTQLATALARQLRWAMHYSGDRGINIAPSPPTVTYAYSTGSAINGSGNAAGLPSGGLYAKLAYAGAQSYGIATGNPNNNALIAYGTANTDGALPPANLYRVRFQIITPQFEVCFSEATGSKINALVDGQLLASGAGVVPNALQSGNTRYLKFDFGSDTTTYGVAQSGISAAGTGYAAGDAVTLVGGTYTRPASYRVGATTGGNNAVFNLYTQDPGSYTALPSWPAATTTTGSGTGLTLSQPFLSPCHTTLKPRRIELLIENAYLFGINYNAPSSGEPAITPYYFNPVVPKLYWLGDSQDAHTYGTYAGGEMGFLVAQRLGMGDNLTIDARGGTGFNTPNGTAPAFDYASRANAVIAAAPDVVYFPYSQNIGSNTQATSQTAALGFVNTLMAALPATLFVMDGPAFGAQSWHQAAMNYVAANCLDQSRLGVIQNGQYALGAVG